MQRLCTFYESVNLQNCARIRLQIFTRNYFIQAHEMRKKNNNNICIVMLCTWYIVIHKNWKAATTWRRRESFWGFTNWMVKSLMFANFTPILEYQLRCIMQPVLYKKKYIYLLFHKVFFRLFLIFIRFFSNELFLSFKLILTNMLMHICE